MYRINHLQRNVLITVDEVIFHAPTKHTLDHRIVQQSIIIAEESHVRPAIGNALYYHLLEQKNKVVTAENKEELQQDILSDTGQTAVLKEGTIMNAAEFLSESDLELWRQHLWKLTAECVAFISAPEAFIQLGSEGVVHNVPSGGAMNSGSLETPALGSMKWLMDKKLQNRIDPLISAMHEWICFKKKNYPLYSVPCQCDEQDTARGKRSGFVLGVYDEDDKNCCY